MLKVEIVTVRRVGRKTGESVSYQLKVTLTTEPPVEFLSRPVASTALILEAHEKILEAVRREMDWLDIEGKP